MNEGGSGAEYFSSKRGGSFTAIIDPSLFKWGVPKKSLAELRSIASKTKLTGPGWIGNEMEDEWSIAISDVSRRKTSKLNSQGFSKFDKSWLLIYDNLDSGNIDLSSAYLVKELVDYWSEIPLIKYSSKLEFRD